LEDVVVFGDGLNDLNMFSPQWFSIAMGNGCTALKEKADYVTGDCDKGGIMAACKKFGWI
jgi:hydroxymethylpyrimidine pyrophosphatase-like HAD family hydrolase